MWAIKFKEKGEKQYKTAIIKADTMAEAQLIFKKEILDCEWLDVDKRTVSWAGGSIPLTHDNLVVLHNCNLDDHV